MQSNKVSQLIAIDRQSGNGQDSGCSKSFSKDGKDGKDDTNSWLSPTKVYRMRW